ncbi:MAG: hypothetical protein JW820_12135 [Spirochaetales bacterium]|nr:hypothetical protein [Spirochaetales bacterium]
MTERVLYTLLIGAVGVTVGYLAQRSRMCFVAGLRDFILVRDRELLNGLFSFLLTVWILTSIFYALNLLEQRMPEFGEVRVMTAVEGAGAGTERGPGRIGLAATLRTFRILQSPDAAGSGAGGLRALLGRFFWTSLGGGALIGFLSVLAGGCVLRQHVLCAQGNRSALLFILGFYAAAVVLGLLFFDPLLWFYG